MAGFNVNQADNYGGQGGGGFFSLRNDKDIAKVRILYQDINDVMGYSVHEVELGGKKRYVNCLREYGDPVDACPFCKAGRFTQVKYFVPIYTESIVSNGAETPVGSLQTWERGKQFYGKLAGLYYHVVGVVGLVHADAYLIGRGCCLNRRIDDASVIFAVRIGSEDEQPVCKLIHCFIIHK